MADGSYAFNFPPPQLSALRPGEIVVDLFAGGGGASEALKQALGVDPALAYNHDDEAIGMHAANHPLTAHHREDIWHADPRKDVAGRPVGWFHASPDCTHFSQAKGGQPRNRKIRALTWVVLKWAGQLQRVGCAPRIISLENVRQILTWGPLVAKRDKATGRVVKMDGTVAAKGERVPVENQQLVPDKRHAGRTWCQFVAALEALGYVVEWRILSAADYGAGTSRERLFLVARRDGEPIQWPEPTHGPGRARPHVPAADCLDFTIPCPSIFTRKRPLADATMRRIARGVMRHVIEAEEPFFITEFANASNGRTWSGAEPLRTQCAGVKGGHFALVSAFLEQANGGGPNGNPAPARSCRQPVSAITASGSQQRLVTAHLEKYDAPHGRDSGSDSSRALRGSPGRDHLAAQAAGRVGQCAPGEAEVGGTQDAQRLSRDQDGRGSKAVLGVRTPAGLDDSSRTDPGGTADQPHRRGQGEQPAGELGAGHAVGEHPARVRDGLEGPGAEHSGPEAAPGEGCGEGATGDRNVLLGDCEGTGDFADAGIQGRALRVAAFLTTYYGNGQPVDLDKPLPTVTTRDRMALVTVVIRGTPYVIVDIGLRMLRPHELYRAQGFPAGYIHDRTADGRPLSVTAQVRMVGNSVSPPPLRAIAEANLDVVEPMRLAA